MDEFTTRDPREIDEGDVGVAGTTFVLAELGWEASDYVDPAEDWNRQADGSYLSPDGTMRTWPLGGGDV
jgi:hypothetical protein